MSSSRPFFNALGHWGRVNIRVQGGKRWFLSWSIWMYIFKDTFKAFPCFLIGHQPVLRGTRDDPQLVCSQCGMNCYSPANGLFTIPSIFTHPALQKSIVSEQTSLTGDCKDTILLTVGVPWIVSPSNKPEPTQTMKYEATFVNYGDLTNSQKLDMYTSMFIFYQRKPLSRFFRRHFRGEKYDC